MDDERRQGTMLQFEPAAGLLVVGAKTAVLDAEPAPEAVVGTYVELVVAQRAVTPASHDDLRARELVELAALLELPPAELDALIDQALDELLGRVVEGPGATPTGRRLRVTAIAGVAAAIVTAAVLLASGGADTPAPAPDAPGVATVEVVTLPDGSTAIRTESAPVPASDGTDIGTAVRYEREP